MSFEQSNLNVPQQIGWIPRLVKDISAINELSIRKNDKIETIRYIDIASVNNRTVEQLQIMEMGDAPSRARRIVRDNDILISTVRPNLKHYTIVRKAMEDMIASTGFAVITPKNVDPEFLYYFLTSDAYTRYLTQIAEGQTSAYPAFNPDIIENTTVYLPPAQEQTAIGKLLSDLDRKIELNNAINKNLEEMAQALFKQWFVDFEFPNENGEPYKSNGGEFEKSELGLIPKGWFTKTLEEISKDEIVCGKTPSTKDQSNFGEDIPFITIPDMHNKVFVIRTQRYLSRKGALTQPSKTIPVNSVCVSCIATPGLVCLTSESSQTNQQINTIICKENEHYFVYLTLSNMSSYIKNMGSGGSVALNLNKSRFSNIKVVYPVKTLLIRFHQIVEPLFQNLLTLQKENENLASIRDTLLPKLISGEIRVPLEQELSDPDLPVVAESTATYQA